MRFFFTTLIQLFIFAQAHSQSLTITGTIVTPEKQSVDVANIILLDKPDSNYVDGMVTYDGHFSMDISSPKDKILQITALGFADLWIDIDASNPDLGIIQLSKTNFTIKEAVVKAKTPHFEQKNGILNVNVENTSLSASGTAIDVLKRTPGIFLSRDDESVQMFGKGNVKVFLDGQEVQSMDIVKSLNSEEIVKIEVIRNPSAKYDAEGQGGVINIITKNSRLEGLLGNITANTTRATYSRAFLRADLSYKKGKLGLFTSVSWNPYKTFKDEEFTRIITQPTTTFKLKNNVLTDYSSWNNNVFSTKVSYSLSQKHTIKVGYRAKLDNSKEITVNSNNIFKGTTNIQHIKTKSNANDNLHYGISDLQYRYADTLQRAFTVSLNHTGYNTKNTSFINEQLSGGSPLFRKSQADGKVQIILGRLDYEQPLFNHFMMAEIGTKLSNTTNKSHTDFFKRVNENENWKSTGQIADAINYTELESAIYTDLSKEAGKWTFKAGLRFENSVAQASSDLSGNYYDTTYQNFFPSGLIEYAFTDEIVANISLSKRIERPDYYDLNPFVNYLDSFSIMKGNPNLVPEIKNEIEFNGSYSGYPLLTLGYSFTNNPIEITVESDATNPLINVGIYNNLTSEEKYYGQIILPYKNAWWTSANGFGYSRRFIKDDVFNAGKIFKKDEKFVFSYQDFNVKDVNFGAQYVWFGPGLEGIFEYTSGWFVNLWLGRKFLDGKLSARLTADDIFKSQIVTAHSTIGKLYIEQKAYEDSRRVRLTLKYKFGKLKNKVNISTKTSKELDRIKL